jgi:hypothetical protein
MEVGVPRKLKGLLVLECGNILGRGGEFSRDLLDLK